MAISSRCCAFLVLTSLLAMPAWGAADIEVNSPGVVTLKKSMADRHGQLSGFYGSGALGITNDGLIAIRDNTGIPLSQRSAVTALVAAENQDRLALYREIARANNHPEWESEVRSTFAQRWLDKAQAGWWVQGPRGDWQQKK